MTLFEECIEALRNDVEILTNEESAIISEKLQKTFPFSQFGRIRWNEVPLKTSVINIQDIPISEISNDEVDVYIIWDDMKFPVVKSVLSNVLDKIDDVTAVSFDTWIFCESIGVVIEFYHEGEIIIGKIKGENKE